MSKQQILPFTPRAFSKFILALLFLCFVGSSWANWLQVQKFLPDRNQHSIQQVMVRFSTDAVAFGNPQKTDPFLVRCGSNPQLEQNPLISAKDKAEISGSGYWLNSREWVFNFSNRLPPDRACLVQANPQFSGLNGTKPNPQLRYSFLVGPTSLEYLNPRQAEEDQIFRLKFSNPVDEKSLLRLAVCRVDSVGEDLPIKLITAEQRKQLIKQLDIKDDPATYYLRCGRKLTPKDQGKIHIPAGLKSAALGSLTIKPITTGFEVRDNFTVEVNCQRRTAARPCLPTSAINLTFSEQITQADAEKITLTLPNGSQLKPILSTTGSTPTLVDGKTEYKIIKATFAATNLDKQQLQLNLPANITDSSGRKLTNQAAFPMQIPTDSMPSILKFASSNFGILELHAVDKQAPLLPVRVRNLGLTAQETTAATKQSKLFTLTIHDDTEIIRWWERLESHSNEHRIYNKASLQARAQKLQLPPAKLTTLLKQLDQQGWVSTAAMPLIEQQADSHQIAWPTTENDRALTNIGIPLEAGFHLIEASSPNLDPYNKQPNYIQTSALVTNMAVHIKTSENKAVVWVTSLDKAQPVSGAKIKLSNRYGKLLASGTTDANGLVTIENLTDSVYFVSARATDSKTNQPDLSFTFTDWDNGIEPWRFSVNSGYTSTDDLVIHSILDRQLLRVGETLSMKHIVRRTTLSGLSFAESNITKAEIIHLGSDQKYPLSLKALTKGSYVSSIDLPKNAKLGHYNVLLYLNNSKYPKTTAKFQIEAFRLPFYNGSIKALAADSIKPKNLTGQVQLNYINGGAAANLPVQVSAQLGPAYIYFPDYSDYSFNFTDTNGSQSLLNNQDYQLDKQGQANFDLNNLNWSGNQPQQLGLTTSYPDPNGEIQTISSTTRLWHAELLPGIDLPYWLNSGKEASVPTIVLNTKGKPQAGVAVTISGSMEKTWSIRNRLVGGLYSYQHENTNTELGTLCSGKTDAKGKFNCKFQPKESGDLILTMAVTDQYGNSSKTSGEVWISTQRDENWFEVEDNNRIDLVADKNSYKPGEQASFQIKTPFRQSTAWITVERDAILHQEIVNLSNSNPYIKLKIDPDWGPNVTVSALVVRGRVYATTWRSFFSWGWRSPIVWFKEWWGGSGAEYKLPTNMVDLSKPSFRMGAIGIAVDSEQYKLQVAVKPEQAKYQIREKAKVKIQVTTAAGKPAPANVAIAVVDKALLELKPNTSWRLYEAMNPLRSWSISTYTAQMQVVGRRHFGIKSAAAGGGGGVAGPQRELFDTLVLWQPNLVLDAEGKAEIEVPLNDSLTSFKIVALADYQQQFFGVGEAEISTGQDLQLISGLPPVVREGDDFRASFTLRNSTDKKMDIAVSAKLQSNPTVKQQPAAQKISLAPQSAQTIWWDIKVPSTNGIANTSDLDWQITAQDKTTGASDQLALRQQTLVALPLQVRQSALVQLNAANQHKFSLPIQSSPDSVSGRGGIKLSFTPKLASGLEAIQDWYRDYPFSCFEQQAGRYIVLRDIDGWHKLMQDMPNYIASNKLLQYFPVSADYNQGSLFLTTYVLNLATEMQQLDQRFTIPAAQLERLLQGLEQVIAGKSNAYDKRSMLFSIETLARYGKANAAMLNKVEFSETEWDASLTLSMATILKNTPNVPNAKQRQQQVNQRLHNMLNYQGAKLFFGQADKQAWRYMGSNDLATAQLILLALDRADWKDELPRLLTGFIAQQGNNGTWYNTTANTYASIALEKFSRKLEKDPVNGTTSARLNQQQQSLNWAKVSTAKSSSDNKELPSVQSTATTSTAANQLFFAHKAAAGAGVNTLTINHKGSGNPWVTLQSIEALRLKQAVSNGIAVKKTITPVTVAKADSYSKGDVLKVRLEIKSPNNIAWVAINDPIPTGASILGSGLGRDNAQATAGERRNYNSWTAFIERDFSAYRHYFIRLNSGDTVVEYSIRLNNEGTFSLPATRVEALYSPEIFAETPNPTFSVMALN